MARTTVAGEPLTTNIAGRASRVATLSAALLFTLVCPAVCASPQAAHEHYVRAVELVRQGELRAAKEEFERAFAESPHPAVLYNLARVCFDLGEFEEARVHAEGFLAKTGPGTAEQQREGIRRMLEGLARRDESPRVSASEPVNDIARPSDVAAPSAAQPAKLAVHSEPRASVVRPRCPACPRPKPVDALLATERGRTAGITLGVTGTVARAVGTGVLIWNADEARAAERERRALAERPPPPEVDDQQDLLDVLTHERAVSKNQEAFRSVARFDVVGWSLVGVGAAMLGTGVVLVLSHTSVAEPTLSLRGRGLALTARF